MSVVKVYKARHTLPRKLRLNATMDVPSAVRRAEAAVAEIAPRLLAAVDADIDAAESALADYLQGSAPEALKRIYDCGDRLAGIAAACNLRPLADAALGTCELLDGMDVTGRADPRAVAVHVSALRLLRTDGDEGAESVLSGLARVRVRYAEPGA